MSWQFGFVNPNRMFSHFLIVDKLAVSSKEKVD